MKFKKVLPLIIIALITFVGCKSDTVSKDELKTEEVATITMENEQGEQKENIKEDITKDKALEIALEAFEKYFNEKVNKDKLQERIALVPDPSTPNPYWSLIWNSSQSIENENRIIEYMANIDSKTGNIMHISARNIDLRKAPEQFDLEEAIEIGLDFIKNHELYPNDQMEFVENNDGGEMYPQEDEGAFYLDFAATDDVNKRIFIQVNKTEKKVVSFGFAY